MSDFEEFVRSQGFSGDFQRGCNGQYKSDLLHFMEKAFMHQQTEIYRLNNVLAERTKEWLQAIELGAYFENVAKPLKEENDRLKTQLNNMEACYIQVKKERDDAVYLKNEHRKRRCQLAKELTHKSLRLTDAEFEYKRIKELQAKDCLQIMRLTAKNEKLNDELKALRGAND